MAKMTKEDIISTIKEMTILEVNELVDLMKEELGVDPSAVAVAAAPAAIVEEGPSSVNIVLKAAGPNKVAVIKIVRELTGLGIADAKAIADNGGVVKEKVDTDEANEIKAKFEEVQAEVAFE
ncbi:MAG: 50S ribosomal protein L7/L12 [Bacilli bacterium]|nr:50S ribosomal protein L7/L12 [Bacilli bacterium]MDD4808863.1 50S ribosomal protein L7/L12 [Bacilli bacterium]